MNVSIKKWRHNDRLNLSGANLAMKYLLIISVSIFLQSCIYYNYATEATPETTKYLVKSPYMRGDDWQFYTALYDEDGFYLELHHLWRQHHAQGLEKYHQIHLESYQSKNSDNPLLMDSISVSVMDKKGNIINQVKPPSVYERGAAIFFYPEDLPSNLIEVIEFSVRTDSGDKKISYRLPVKKKLNYTYWSVMVSV